MHGPWSGGGAVVRAFRRRSGSATRASHSSNWELHVDPELAAAIAASSWAISASSFWTVGVSPAATAAARFWTSDARFACRAARSPVLPVTASGRRSEEHTSELQSLRHLVCRLLLEKKKERQ